MNLLDKNESIINPQIIKGLMEMGFEQLTPIQEQAIPVMLDGKDIIGQAQTGTGKTAAFGIPLVQMVDTECENVQGIVLCPTRELAIQAAEGIRKIAKYLHGVKVLPIYGGQDINTQIRSLRGKVSIVVGTPGRVMDHLRRHTLKLDNLKMMVLDEADEMLNMGFREDIEEILKTIPSEHQTALFSATMPKSILDITKEYQKNDAHLIRVAHKELTIPLVKQYYYEVNSHNKEDVAARLLDYYNPKLCLIFCNTKHMVDTLCENLKGRGYFAEALHGDMSQNQRDKVMRGFRTGNVDILIATDVAARGIDVDDVEAVINYDIPQDIEYYVHRIGRTGRAGRKGRAFTLVVGRDIFKIREIEQACKTTMKPRNIPSAKDVSAAKADSIFNELLKIREDEDLTTMLHLIQEKIDEYDCTALEIAAAFLKKQMGEEQNEIIIDKFVPKKRGRFGNGDDKDGRRSRDPRRSGGRDDRNQGQRRSGGRDDRNQGQRRGGRDDRDQSQSQNQRRGGRDDRDQSQSQGQRRGGRDDRDQSQNQGQRRGGRDDRDQSQNQNQRRGGRDDRDFNKSSRKSDGDRKPPVTDNKRDAFFDKIVSSNDQYEKKKTKKSEKDELKKVMEEYEALISKKKKPKKDKKSSDKH